MGSRSHGVSVLGCGCSISVTRRFVMAHRNRHGIFSYTCVKTNRNKHDVFLVHMHSRMVSLTHVSVSST